MNPQQKLEQDLETILLSEKLQWRGWKLSRIQAPLDPESSRKAWPIYSVPPKTNEIGEVIGNPEILFYLDTNEVEFKGTFEFLPDPILFCGRVYQFQPEIVINQRLELEDARNGFFIDFDARKVKSYGTTRVIPDFVSFRDAVEKWAQKYQKAKLGQSQKEYEHCRYIVGQLSAVKKNTIETVSVAVAELNNTIKQHEPDYFSLLEQAMQGTISREELEEAGKGAFVVSSDPQIFLRPKEQVV